MIQKQDVVNVNVLYLVVQVDFSLSVVIPQVAVVGVAAARGGDGVSCS